MQVVTYFPYRRTSSAAEGFKPQLELPTLYQRYIDRQTIYQTLYRRKRFHRIRRIVTTCRRPRPLSPDEGLPYSAGVLPYPDEGFPDAALSYLAAALLHLDEALLCPNAGLQYPDAGLSCPEAGLPYPGAGLPYPDAALLAPEAGQAYPDATLSLPPASVDAVGTPPDLLPSLLRRPSLPLLAWRRTLSPGSLAPRSASMP